MLKTKTGWDESRKTLTEYLDIKDEVDDSMIDYFLGVVPPIMKPGLLQIGEPYSTNGHGKFTYMSLKKNAGKWFYIGVLSTKDAIEYKFN